MPRSRLVVGGIAALVALTTPAHSYGADIFDLEETTLQRKLDEAWAYSVESRERRGGVRLNTESAEPGTYAIFAMSLFTEFGAQYDGTHLAFGMVNFKSPDPLAFGHGPTFGYSRFAAQESQRWPMLAGFHLQGGEASTDRVFAGWNFGFPVAFAEVGWRFQWLDTNAHLLQKVDAVSAAQYAGRPGDAFETGPFAKLRVGAKAYGLKAFAAPGKDNKSLRQAYLEPSYRLDLGEWALTTTLGYKTLRSEDGGRGTLASLTETVQFGRELVAKQAEGEESYFNRQVVTVSVDSLWRGDAWREALGGLRSYTFRAETEFPLYLGAWYNREEGFGWGAGVAATSEWVESGQTMRIVLRYLRHEVAAEPLAERVTPWKAQLIAVVGW